MQAGGGVKAAADEEGFTSLSYYALGMYDKAAEAYEALLNSKQSYYTKAQICSCIAKCRVLLGEYDAAVKACDRGLAEKERGERATLYALRASKDGQGAYSARPPTSSVVESGTRIQDAVRQAPPAALTAATMRRRKYGQLALRRRAGR